MNLKVLLFVLLFFTTAHGWEGTVPFVRSNGNQFDVHLTIWGDEGAVELPIGSGNRNVKCPFVVQKSEAYSVNEPSNQGLGGGLARVGITHYPVTENYDFNASCPCRAESGESQTIRIAGHYSRLRVKSVSPRGKSTVEFPWRLSMKFRLENSRLAKSVNVGEIPEFALEEPKR